MSTKDRVIEFLKYKGLSQLKFEETVGLSRGYVNNIGDSIRESSLMKIASKFPELNIIWLKAGVGSMLINGEEDTLYTGDELRDMEATAKLVPLIPLSAQGGKLNDFVMSVKDGDCEKIISPINGADCAIPVSGDSMAPEYPNGSTIFIKRINEKAFIDWGRTYVLDTCNGTVVKILVPAQRDGYIKCCSINTDPKYAPFEVSLSDVYGVYRVLLCLAVK